MTDVNDKFSHYKLSLELLTMQLRPMRETLHLASATMWSMRSVCKRAKHGCVITNMRHDKVLAFGYNGPARGLPNDRCRGTEGNCGCLHAEMNAVAGCESFNEPKTAFITAAPCEICAQLLIQANVVQVCYIDDYRDKTGVNLLSSTTPKIMVLQLNPKISVRIEAVMVPQ